MNLRKDQYHSQLKIYQPRFQSYAGTFSAHKTLFWPTSHRWFLNKQTTNQNPPFNDGSLGSSNDEERRETRYVMWIAGLSESSNLWTQIAAPALAVGACLVQTRLPNAKCSTNRIDYGCCHTASLQETMMACAPLASKRCAEVVKHQGASCFTVDKLLIRALELDSGKRTRWI